MVLRLLTSSLLALLVRKIDLKPHVPKDYYCYIQHLQQGHMTTKYIFKVPFCFLSVKRFLSLKILLSKKQFYGTKKE